MTNDDEQSRYPGAEHDAVWRRLVFPRGYANPRPVRRYHLVVIGAGPAGLVASVAAAGLGARVALVEKTAMGGDCLNVGCVPSKSLLEFAKRSNGRADFGAAFEWMRRVRAAIAAHDSVERLSAAGVDVFLGPAQLESGMRVRAGDATLSARRIVITTGARPSMPPIPGLADSAPLTNETIFDLRAQPARIAIIGGGPIGCELAQAFARLGTAVYLLEQAQHVMPTESKEAGLAVEASLREDGVDLRLGVTVERVDRDSTGVTVQTSEGSVTAEQLLTATGRRANTEDLALEAAGVATDERGLIKTDRYLRTTNRRIYAAGDVCSTLQFTHCADAHARIVVQNALFAPTATTRRLWIPRCTYTDPEVARLGPHEAELREAGTPFDAYRVRFGELDRGRTQGDRSGFAEVLTTRGGTRILGATLVGPDAGEQIAPLCIAARNGLGIEALGSAVLPYPTRAEYLRKMADQYNRSRLTASRRKLLGAFLRWTA